MTAFLRRHRHALAIIPFLLATAWFFLLEKQNVSPTYYVEVPLDDHIPFIPWFVVPYTLWYLYVAVTLGFFFLKSPREFVRLSMFLAAGMAVACAIFALFPNGQLLRPRQTGGGLFGDMIGGIYRADTPANSLPSIHVIYTMGVHIALSKYLNGRFVPVRIASFVLATLICASTVCIKQHSILCVLAGSVVTFILYNIFYGRRARLFLASVFAERRGYEMQG